MTNDDFSFVPSIRRRFDTMELRLIVCNPKEILDSAFDVHTEARFYQWILASLFSNEECESH